MGTFVSAKLLTEGDLFVITSGRDAAPKLRRCVRARRFRSGGDYATISYTNVADGGAGEVSMMDGSDQVEVLSRIDGGLPELEAMLDLLDGGERVTLWAADDGIWA